MAEPIEMQSRMQSQVGPGDMHYMRMQTPTGRGTFVVSGRFKAL